MIKKDSLQIDQDNIKGMDSNVYELVDFDRNNQMNMRMIEERNNKIKEEREMTVLKQSAIESQKERKIRHAKNLKRRKIKAAFYVAAGIAIGTAGYQAYAHVEGKNEIVSEFSNATASFGVRDDSNSGYIINEGNSYVSFEDGVNRMVQSARDNGMNTQEIAIGLTSTFNKSVAIEALGEDNYPSFSERNKMYESAYHENKINGLGQNVEKGNGK